MRRLPLPVLVLVLVLVLVAAPSAALAQTVTVKLGTVAPDGSAWHMLLKEMGQQWGEISGGKVKFKIFPGGIQGNEGDVIRKMRIGQLQAGAVSSVGLRDIDSGLQALGVPGMIDSDEELAFVYQKIAPVLEKRLKDKGFTVLSWGDTGWARLFTKREARTPKDVKGLKVFAWSGDPSAVDAWKSAGFQPVVISVTDMLPSLSTGMIEGFATAPLLAMTARWYEQTNYMLDFKWGRLAGATILTNEAYEKIPDDIRPKILESARQTGAKVEKEIAKMEKDSIEAMQKNQKSFKVVELTEAERAEWQRTAEAMWPVLRGGTISPEDFDLVKAARDEFRAKVGKK